MRACHLRARQPCPRRLDHRSRASRAAALIASTSSCRAATMTPSTHATAGGSTSCWDARTCTARAGAVPSSRGPTARARHHSRRQCCASTGCRRSSSCAGASAPRTAAGCVTAATRQRWTPHRCCGDARRVVAVCCGIDVAAAVSITTAPRHARNPRGCHHCHASTPGPADRGAAPASAPSSPSPSPRSRSCCC